MRPSSLQLFTRRGFESTDEIEESRINGGINLLASELDVSLQEAAGLIREVQGCLSAFRDVGSGDDTDRIGHGNADGNGNNSSSNNKDGVDGNPSPSSPVSQQKMKQQQQLQSPHDDGILTAYDLLHMHDQQSSQQDGISSNRHVVTFCKAVDKLLGGGISLGQVTEISGLPGTGKTQLATQLSVLARLPREFGGVEGRTLYVDAEGSFVPERAYSMANALCDHTLATARRRRRRQQNHHHQRNHNDRNIDDGVTPNLTIDDILDSIDVFRVHDETALLATLYSLQKYVEESQQEWRYQLDNQQGGDGPKVNGDGRTSSSSSPLPVRLIVIDSIAFHFRAVVPTGPSYYVQRTKTLTALAAYLGDLAIKHDLAVVVINQMTTKVNNYNNNSNQYGGSSFSSSSIPSSLSSTVMVPALGESWAHATATRLLLSSEEHSDLYIKGGDRQVRTCTLIKSAHRPTGTTPFRILEIGIRDVPDEIMVVGRSSSNSDDNDTNKRPRTLLHTGH